MNIDDFLEGKPNSQKFEVNIGVCLLRILETANNNSYTLTSILKKQLELKELLKGRTESDFDEEVLEKLKEAIENIDELASKNYNRMLEKILDHNP